MVFLHGLGCAPRQWRFQLEHFFGRRVLAPCLPGHGAPPPTRYAAGEIADLLWAGIRSWQSQPVVLIGHSLGANLAAIMAARLPGSVAGVILADPTGDLRMADFAERAQVEEWLLPENYPRKIRSWFTEAMGPTAPELRREILDDLSSVPRDVFAGYWSAFCSADALAPVRALQDRSLCIASEQAAEAYLFQRLLPGLPCRSLAAGHWLHLDRPAEFNEAVERFLLERGL